MMIILFLVYVLVLIFLAMLFSKKEGYYSTVIVFGICNFIYNLLIPLYIYITDKGFFVGEIYWVYLSSDDQIKVFAMGLMALIAFASGYSLYAVNVLKKDCSLVYLKKSIIILFIILCVSLVLLFSFSSSLIDGISSYISRPSIVFNNPSFSFVTNLIVVNLSIISGILFIKRRKTIIAIILLCICIGWGFYISDKNPILIALLALPIYFYNNWIRKFSFFMILLIGITFFIFLIPAFSLYRADISLKDIVDKYKDFSLTKNDYSGPMISLSKFVNNKEPLYGSTYAESFCLFIPRFIWPDRPDDPTVTFAKQEISDYEPGLGLGYSALGEAYLNFGILGPLFVYFIFGVCWGLLWRFIFQLLTSQYSLLSVTMYYIIGYNELILMHRSLIVGVFKHILFLIAVVLVTKFLFEKFSKERAGRILKNYKNKFYHEYE